MALNPAVLFAGKITAPTAAYPYGSARDISAPSAGDGTPWIAALVNDIFGFQQAILDAGGAIVPSGSPDEVGASQYLTALNAIIATAVAAGSGGGFGATDLKKAISYVLLAADYADKTLVYTGAVDAAFTNLSSASLTAGDYVFFEHRGSAGLLTIDFANASDGIGNTALGISSKVLSPGQVIRLQFTGDANVWRLG